MITQEYLNDLDEYIRSLKLIKRFNKKYGQTPMVVTPLPKHNHIFDTKKNNEYL